MAIWNKMMLIMSLATACSGPTTSVELSANTGSDAQAFSALKSVMATVAFQAQFKSLAKQPWTSDFTQQLQQLASAASPLTGTLARQRLATFQHSYGSLDEFFTAARLNAEAIGPGDFSNAQAIAAAVQNGQSIVASPEVYARLLYLAASVYTARQLATGSSLALQDASSDTAPTVKTWSSGYWQYTSIMLGGAAAQIAIGGNGDVVVSCSNGGNPILASADASTPVACKASATPSGPPVLAASATAGKGAHSVNSDCTQPTYYYPAQEGGGSVTVLATGKVSSVNGYAAQPPTPPTLPPTCTPGL